MANNQSVRRHLDAFTRGRIIGKLEEGRSVTSVAAEFGIAHSIVSRLWRQFQTTGRATRGFSSGRPRGNTPADDRYIVLQARRNRRQTAGEIARHTTQATGRPISRFTVARRLHGGGLFARRPVRCVPLTPAHRRRRSLWCLEHRNWRDNEWGRVLFTDESRFSLSSDSHRILIWRERGSRNHPSNIIERDRYGGRGVLVWGGIMLGNRTDLHIFDAGSVNGTRYCNKILLPYVRLFRGAMGLQFLFMDDNAPCHRTVAAEQLLESEDIERRDWPARSPDLNPIEHTNHDDTLLLECQLGKNTFYVILRHPSGITVSDVGSCAEDPGLESCFSFDQSYLYEERCALPDRTYFRPTWSLRTCNQQSQIFHAAIMALKIEWHEKLPVPVAAEWVSFVQSLPVLERLKIPRFVLSENLESIILYGFSDASEKEFGAVTNVSVIKNNGDRRSQLLCSKSRVAPLKT
ncbi:transposable element Tc1 transposase [Trichonephila clavipes]|nr:transposable element Tc1 transposase [Trichonephila clavipes]